MHFPNYTYILNCFIFLLFSNSCTQAPSNLKQNSSSIKQALVSNASKLGLEQYPTATRLLDSKTLETWQKNTPTDIVLIDVRPKAAFDKGHIIGAQQVWRPDIRSKAFPFGGMMLEKEALAQLMGSLGATAQSKIILYDSKGNVDAARLWWMLTFYGHSNSYLLNGGLQACPPSLMSQDSTVVQPTSFVFSNPERPELKASKADVLAAIQDDATFLLDCRTLEEYIGTVMKTGAFRAGHIPSAVHLNYSEAIAYENNCIFRDYADLVERFKNIPKDKKIIVYCQSGVRSAHTTFVLRELLGYSNVSNYDGSWIEWSYDKKMPISSGV